MARSGRLRLGTAEPFAAIVDSVVPRPGIGDADAVRLHEFVERLSDDGTHRGLIAVAPHGGDIERHTDTQAERVAERLAEYGVSAWRCRGFAPPGGAADRLFHITSTEIHEASFPRLGSVISRGFSHAVAFHGAVHDDVLVGGGASFRLKAEIASALEIALSGSRLRVRIAGPEDILGASPRNLVNRLSASGRGGINLEQGNRARAEYGLAIADAVAEVFAGRLNRQAHTDRSWWRLPSRWTRS